MQAHTCGGVHDVWRHTCTARAQQCVTRPYHAAAFGWWVVVTAAILPAHLTLLLQQGQCLAGVEQSQVAQALCHHIATLLFCLTAAEQQSRHLQQNLNQVKKEPRAHTGAGQQVTQLQKPMSDQRQRLLQTVPS